MSWGWGWGWGASPCLDSSEHTNVCPILVGVPKLLKQEMGTIPIFRFKFDVWPNYCI